MGKKKSCQSGGWRKSGKGIMHRHVWVGTDNDNFDLWRWHLLRRGCKAELIFLTACKEYVFSCFCLDTFRYLLKPLREDLLKEALDAFCRKKMEEDRLLYLKFGDQNYSIRSQEIVYIEVMRGKIWIYTDTDCFRWSGTLNALEEMLPCPPFYRVHLSFLNLRHQFWVWGLT